MEQFGVDPDDVVPHTRLIEDLGVAPLEVVELVATLEDEFDLEIPDEHAQELRTVGDVVAYLERRSSPAHQGLEVAQGAGADPIVHDRPAVPASWETADTP